MAGTKQATLRTASALLPPSFQNSLLAWFSQDLKREFIDGLTDGFLEALLGSMETAFALSRSYRRNIAGFNAVFVFRTEDDHVGASAVFHGGRMVLERHPRARFDTRITFKDAEGLSHSLLSGSQDILNTMLSSPVRVEGNLNCLYRFGFLSQELLLKLGLN
jgi:hypothetical protein